MIVLFSNSRGPISKLIRIATWSKWSHVAILDGDHVIESLGGVGVVRTPLCKFHQRVSHCVAVEFSHVNTAAALAFCRSQIGKGYDFGAIFGIGFRRNWQDPTRWSCVELIIAAAAHAGTPLIRAEAAWRATPQHLWLVAGKPVVVDFECPAYV